MSSIKAIILDDEPKACKLLQLLIEEIDPSIHITSTYTNPTAALASGELQKTQLLFLDIDMPGMTGFDLLRALGVDAPLVIFVTGYDNYAIQAMQLAAVGYILKPIHTEDLALALKEAHVRLSQQIQTSQQRVLLENISIQNARLKKIGIPSVAGFDFVVIDEIIRCQGTDKYTRVITQNGQEILSSYNIGEFTKLLSELGFFQTHRSHLANLKRIKQYQKEGILIMDDLSQIPLARRRREEFLALMTTLHR